LTKPDQRGVTCWQLGQFLFH